MKKVVLLLIVNLAGSLFIYVYGQHEIPGDTRNAIVALINEYSEAREKRDTTLLKKIMTTDVDELVSTGEWRNGIGAAVEGMMKSSAATPGTRTLTVDKVRMLTPVIAIADCKYEIQNKDGSIRKMWSSFFVMADKAVWKITAIRNMLPASQ